MSVVRIALLFLGVTLVICADSSDKPPQVYVYTRDPIKYGEPNELICHCKNFHPPVISLQLKKNGEEYKDCRETDMTFGQDWTYYITKHIKFTPQDGVEYSCAVQHNNGPVKSYVLDPLM